MVCSHHPTVTLVMQHMQILVLIQDSRSWVEWMSSRRLVAVRREFAPEWSRQSLSDTQAGDGESTQDLVLVDGREAYNKPAIAARGVAM